MLVDTQILFNYLGKNLLTTYLMESSILDIKKILLEHCPNLKKHTSQILFPIFDKTEMTSLNKIIKRIAKVREVYIYPDWRNF